MKDVVKETLAHPIATAFIIYAFGSAIASIISATKGTPFKPFIDVSKVSFEKKQ